MSKSFIDLPMLQKITSNEVQDIRNMFSLLCVDNSNRISQHLAIKLFRNLGNLSILFLIGSLPKYPNPNP